MMNVETVARTIQLILAPVVMVTACAILLGSLQTRYGVINDRLRVMAHERLELLMQSRTAPDTAGAGDPFTDERLNQIDAQLPMLLTHHTLCHHAVLVVYCSIAVFLADMFVIALGSLIRSDLLTTLILLLFLAGIGLVLVGTAFVALEVSTSHRALHYEVLRVKNLTIGTWRAKMS
jgi:hypothetical protein